MCCSYRGGEGVSRLPFVDETPIAEKILLTAVIGETHNQRERCNNTPAHANPERIQTCSKVCLNTAFSSASLFAINLLFNRM
ncbi:hypothetical protein TNCT_537131 [Trichonephila clavata]|uniref:Uncharacterized protein n=1 Tax=Trichonephila clavata TaxID=2740835 RepID=A0A8X6IDI3_TRICU|nr:hypothetical protein TNCT_537131 [Trichonephila clavata]